MHGNRITQGNGFWRVEVLVKFVQAGVPEACGQRQRGAHRELALVHIRRVDHRPQHVNCALVYVGDDAGDVLRFQLVHLHHLKQRVCRWVGMPTTRVVFERGFSCSPARAQTVDQFGRVCIGRHASGHALRTLEDLRCTCEPISRQLGRQQPGRSCMSRVQLFGVCAGTQKLPQAARLCAGRAKGMQHLACIQTQ